MTSKYITYGVNLSESQINKIKSAVENKCAISLRLTKKNLHDARGGGARGGGDHKLPLTKTQVKKLENVKTGVDLKLSAAQLKVIKTGGFLPLLTLIPLIAGAVGAAGGLTGGISAAVSAARSNGEQQRHNRVIEEQLKGGSGGGRTTGSGVVSNIVSKVPILGSIFGPLLERIGLGLKDIEKVSRGSCICKSGLAIKKIGNGLYLEPEGSGVFLERRGE